MEQDSLFERLQKSPMFRFFELLYKLIMVNLSIILLSVCGLVVFGLFPAILAAAAYFNDVMEGNETRMLSRMFQYFKQYFWIGNLLMIIVVPAVALVFYLMFGPELNMFVYLIIFCWMLAAMILNLYLPAVNVLYPEFKMGKKFLFSLVVAGNRYLLTILFLVLSIGWMYVVLLVPQLMMFVVFSVPVWFCMWRIKKALKPDSFFDPEEEERKAVREGK